MHIDLTHTPYLTPVDALYSHRAPRDLHSFPTRRSSDLLGHLQQGLREAKWKYIELRPRTWSWEAYEASQAFYLHTLDLDRKSTRLNSSHITISYAVFCLKKKKKN